MIIMHKEQGERGK